MRIQRLLNDVIAPWVEETIVDSNVIDEYTYEVTFDLAATPQGPQPVVFILLAIPDPSNIGQKATAMAPVPGPIPTQQMVETTVLGLISALHEQRQSSLVLP